MCILSSEDGLAVFSDRELQPPLPADFSINTSRKGSSFVVSVGNKLPEVIVEAGTILSFKNQFHGYDGYRGIWAKCGQLGLA